MNIYKNIFLIISVAFGFVLKAQTPEELNRLSKQYLKKDLDSAAYFASEAIELAKSEKDNLQLGFAYKNRATVFYYKNDKKKAIKSFQEAIEYFNKANKLDESSNLYHNLGLIYYKMGYNKESAENYHLAILNKKKIHDEKDLGGTYNGLAVLYQDMSQFDSSTYYLNLAYTLVDKVDTQRLAILYNSIGRNYIYQGIHDSALVYYSKSLDLKKNQKDTLSLALTIENIGQALTAKSNYDTAMSCYFMALDIYEKYDNKQATARVYNNIGNLYLSLNDTSKSEENFIKALNIYKATGNKIGKAGIYNNLGLLKEETKEYEHAKQYYLKANAIFKDEKSYRNLAKSYQNLANNSRFLGNNSDAKYYLSKSNKIAKAKQLVSIYYQNNYSLAELYHKEADDTKANEILEKIDLRLARKYLNEESYLSRLQLSSDIYAGQGRYKDAFETRTEYDSLYKAYFNEKYFEEIAEITTKYQTERVEKENDIFRKQAKIEKLKLENEKEKNKNNEIIIVSILVLLLAFLWMMYSLYRTSRARKKYNEDLVEKNIIISEQHHEIEQTLSLVEQQKEILEKQKEEITDSINYAKRFQTAIIPTEEKLNSIFNNAFVLYKPRDIVSGDFYYIHETDKYKYFVAADCTGHGVPGAFLSIIGHNGLSGALNKFALTDLTEIMGFLNQYLYDFLHQNQDMKIQDGIDLILIRVDEEKQELMYTGAYNPLVLVRDKELLAYKTNKFAVGASKENLFESKTISYKKGDMVYLFSDGYADQFGGPKGKKFMRKRFYQVLTDLSLLPIEKQKNALDMQILAWMKSENQVDDILVVGIHL